MEGYTTLHSPSLETVIIHTLTFSWHSLWLAIHWQFRVQCLARGHPHTLTEGLRDQTAKPLIR